MLKNIGSWLQSRLLEAIAYFLGWMLRLLCLTIRWRRKGEKFVAPAVLVFWHRQQLLMPSNIPSYLNAPLTRKIKVLISAHRDGRIVAAAIKAFNLENIAGSSTRGGGAAMIQMVDELQAGGMVAITPDGPKGPIYKAKEGAIKLSRATGAPIYLCAGYADDERANAWIIKSWDRLIIPKPFSTFNIYAERYSGEMTTEALSAALCRAGCVEKVAA